MVDISARTPLKLDLVTFIATTLLASFSAVAPVSAQMASPAAQATLAIDTAQPGPTINRDIFGQFAEHLGEGIYGGVWVGKNSKIPNVRGIRSDVVQALRDIKVPNVRWPGGCFADEYHWRNGIGPAARRPVTLNGNWGGVMEPNAFGTHEFMDLVEQLDAEAYLSVNVGTGSPQEAAAWLEYMTTAQPTTLGKERIANGRKDPYRIKYLGIGNESWGCGGPMSAEAYVDHLKIYSQFVRNLNPHQNVPPPQRSPNAMQRIAVGPDAHNTDYTETVMKAWKERNFYWNFEGLSLHSYTWGGNPKNAPATDFSEKQYADVLRETLRMDELITRHSAIMDKYDPQKRVALVVDEWGVWLKPMPDTNPNFLKQQNSLRDAILASLNLNIFARHADRVRLANIAQMVNVLQAMILTNNEQMLLTPTYYVFKMYVPFQDAQLISVSLQAGEYAYEKIRLPQVDAIAARAKDGKVWLALTNLDPNNTVEVRANVQGIAATSASGEVLTADAVSAINTFNAPTVVKPKPYRAEAAQGVLSLRLAPKSVTVVRLEP